MLGDSMVRNVDKIKGTDIWCSPGIDIEGCTKMLNSQYLQSHLSLQNRQLIIIAIGTNSISDIKNNSSQREAVVADMINLIAKIRTYTQAPIAISGILPRIIDFKKTNTLIRYTNDKLRNIINDTDNVSFWPTYKPFWNGHFINSDLFRMVGKNRYGKRYADGIHPNEAGAKALRQYFRQRIACKVERAKRPRWGKKVLLKWRNFI